MRKKLVKYLADYIEQEQEDNADLTMQEIVGQGLEAFESTEGVVISVQPDRMSTD